MAGVISHFTGVSETEILELQEQGNKVWPQRILRIQTRKYSDTMNLYFCENLSIMHWFNIKTVFIFILKAATWSLSLISSMHHYAKIETFRT